MVSFLLAYSKATENFLDDAQRLTIKDQGKICTACGNGKVSFVSVTDIAAVAFRALVDEKSHNTDHVVVGPELLTYDDVCYLLFAFEIDMRATLTVAV